MQTPPNSRSPYEATVQAGDDDIDGDLMRARLLARMFDEDEAPPRIGRFEVLRKLGEGGMGRVYACFDDRLGREVAIKLLRGHTGSPQALARLTREAQSLARLSHPNVVQIYEVGDHEGGVYLSMELIPGRDLRAHLDAHPELGWRERLELVLAAGEGLAAAHAAGLVHRDIKPHNVLVGDDGRVRVLDFGLARGDASIVTGEPSDTPTDDPAAASAPSGLARSMTATGTLLGTPNYMAPEQHLGLDASALADQFGFCVMAFEVLHGQRPFRAQTLAELRERVDAGRIDEPSEPTKLPRGVHAAIVRGLAREPGDRWPDMPSLLAALRRGAGRRRRWALGLGALGLLGASASAGALLFASSPPRCEPDPAALAGVWDEAQRAELREAFDRVATPLAATSFPVVAAELDAWAQTWLDSQRGACEATRDGLASAELLDERSACLARTRSTTRAVISVLLDADATTVARSDELLAQLPAPTICLDERPLESRHPLPADPDARARIDQAYRGAAMVLALAAAGQLEAAEARATALAQLADSGALAYAPVELELDALPGRLALRRGDIDAGVSAVVEVVRAAEALHLDDLVAELRLDMALRAVGTWGHPERERWLHADAAAALARVGRPDDPRVVQLALVEGQLLEDAADFEAALGVYTELRARAEAIGELDLAEGARRQLGRTLWSLGRFDEALAELEAARVAVERRWGPAAPAVADRDYDIGALELQRGRFERAREHLQRARQRYAELHGPDSDPVTRVDGTLATCALTRGEFDEAARLLETVIAHREREPERWPKLLADNYEALGAARFYQGDPAASIPAYERALALRASVLAPDHPAIANLHANLGEAHVALGDHAAGEAAFARALELLARSLPPDHPDLALSYKGRGQAALARGRFAEARDDLERALELQRGVSGEPLELADIEFSLARALRGLGEDPRARTLASQARDRYRALDQPQPVAAIERWLAGE